MSPISLGVELADPYTYRYLVTSYGRRVAVLMSKLHTRIFNLTSPALASPQDRSQPIARAFKQIDREVDRLVAHAQLSPA
jgi:hypothetical protein